MKLPTDSKAEQQTKRKGMDTNQSTTGIESHLWWEQH